MGEGTGLKILLVDDDRDQSYILTQHFRVHRPGLDFTLARDGEECLTMLEAGVFSAVILDYVLPDMMGTEVLNEIKSRGYDVPVVMVTGLGDEYVAVEAMKSGAYDYVIKDGKYFNNLPYALDRVLERHDLKVKAAETQKLKEQLYQSAKMAEVGQLVAGVAHELNNPLTAVLGYAQLLQSSEMTPELKGDVDKINVAAQRCKGIVNNLLSFARRHRAEKAPSDMNEAIRETVALRNYELKVNNITVEVACSEDLPPVSMDVHQMQQVLLNLLINAEHALQSGGGRGGRIEIRTELAGQGDGKSVRVSVVDNGPGIKEDDKKRIFEPFYTTKEPGKGTGLGLPICRGIVAEHGGDLWVEDGKGGARFVFEIPLDAGASSVGREVPASSAAGRHPASPGRVLLVDDEMTVLEVMVDILKDEGWDVDMALGGEDAVAKLEGGDYDLIVSDIKMPGVDGRGLYNMLKRTRPGMASRVLFITGDTDAPNTMEFVKCLGDRCLLKPFTADAFKEACGRYLTDNA